LVAPESGVLAGNSIHVFKKMDLGAVLGSAGILGVAACGFDQAEIAFDYHPYSIGYYCWATSVALMTALAFWRSATSTSHGTYLDGGTYLNAPPSTFNEPSSPPTR
jgi:hypothetical protein